MKRPERYQRILRDWPPVAAHTRTGAPARARVPDGFERFGDGLRAKAQAVRRGEQRPSKPDTSPPPMGGQGAGLAAGGALAGLAGAAALLAPVVLGVVAVAALVGGGPVGFLKWSRARAYNYARWGGNVQPWVELRPDKVVRRVVRRKIGKTVGRTFSWPRIFGI